MSRPPVPNGRPTSVSPFSRFAFRFRRVHATGDWAAACVVGFPSFLRRRPPRSSSSPPTNIARVLGERVPKFSYARAAYINNFVPLRRARTRERLFVARLFRLCRYPIALVFDSTHAIGNRFLTTGSFSRVFVVQSTSWHVVVYTHGRIGHYSVV